MRLKLLVDCDYIVYKNAAACETDIQYSDDLIVVQSRFSDLQRSITTDLERIQNYFSSDSDLLLFFSDSKNFRKELYPEYKGHRNRKKPCGYLRAIDWINGEFGPIIQIPKLEADDAIGIYATDPNHDDNFVVVSPDKDLRQIPGRLWNLDFDGVVQTITEESAEEWHLTQTLAGDQTDGYSGCPTIGVKRAVDLFRKHGPTWNTVVNAFKAQNLTEDDALLNARLARILRFENYDFSSGTIKQWVPRSGG